MRELRTCSVLQRTSAADMQMVYPICANTLSKIHGRAAGPLTMRGPMNWSELPESALTP